MTLTKTHIIGAVSKQTGFTKKKSRQSVNTLVEIIKNTLESGTDIKIAHFGKFEIKEKKGRRWRSPFTGAEMMLPPKRVVHFKTFKRLKEKLNETSGHVEPCDTVAAATHHIPVDIRYPDELQNMVIAHRRWLDSEGRKGKKAVLKRARLVRADLYGARRSQVTFREADLHGADLSEADLYEADFQDANLVDAILEWASLDGANLKHADLQGADLRWANLEGTNLTGANLRFADFEGANLKGAKLCEADLYGAKLQNTDMQGTILKEIKVDYETQLNLPKPVFERYRRTFKVLDWSPALASSYQPSA